MDAGGIAGCGHVHIGPQVELWLLLAQTADGLAVILQDASCVPVCVCL